jgi:Protein of unknown function (DUF3800)
MQQTPSQRKVGGILSCHCDDSGSHEEAKVSVVGGIVLSAPRFIDLFVRWGKILKEFRLDKIHMRDFVKPHGRYSTLPSEMKTALFTSVAEAINATKIYTVSAAMPQVEYRTLLTPEICREFMGPYALAFMIVTIINRMAVSLTEYDSRVAYIVDKGSEHHYEQLNGAHTVILHIENREGEAFTGPMTADLDDNNYGLQAADVVAWTYHRKLESPEFGDEFRPLLPIVEHKLERPNQKTKLHLSLDVPHEGIELFASLVNRWLTHVGPLPTWEELLKGQAAYERDKRIRELRPHDAQVDERAS